MGVAGHRRPFNAADHNRSSERGTARHQPRGTASSEREPSVGLNCRNDRAHIRSLRAATARVMCHLAQAEREPGPFVGASSRRETSPSVTPRGPMADMLDSGTGDAGAADARPSTGSWWWSAAWRAPATPGRHSAYIRGELHPV